MSNFQTIGGLLELLHFELADRVCRPKRCAGLDRRSTTIVIVQNNNIVV